MITWKSSNAYVLADDGTVTSPEADTVVELTATASFLDGEAVQKKFNVTVTATTTAAVSYTHLDVYKRQDLHLS